MIMILSSNAIAMEVLSKKKKTALIVSFGFADRLA